MSPYATDTILEPPSARRATIRQLALASLALALAASLGISVSPQPGLDPLPAAAADTGAAPAVVVRNPIAPGPGFDEARAEFRSLRVPAWAPLRLRGLSDAEVAAFQAALDRVRTKFKIAGLSFAMIRADRTAWSGGSGTAEDGSAAGVDTRYVMGSVTKTFVAALALDLAEEGLLSLETRVAELLPGTGIDPAITVEQLLRHTSGLPDLFYPIVNRLLEEPDRRWTASEVVAAAAAASDPWFKPGESWAYSNTNYVLLGMVLEQVTGRPVAAEIERRYLRPLDLDATRADWALPDGERGLIETSWATSFGASGAMSATAADLARWGRALYQGDLLEPGSLERMLRFNEKDYGLGALRIELDGEVGVGHTGLLNRYSSVLLSFPDDHLVVVVMTNKVPLKPYEALVYRDPGQPSLLDLARRVDPPPPAPVELPPEPRPMELTAAS